jgi:hypothetical protein
MQKPERAQVTCIHVADINKSEYFPTSAVSLAD